LTLSGGVGIKIDAVVAENFSGSVGV